MKFRILLFFIIREDVKNVIIFKDKSFFFVVDCLSECY